MSSFKSAGGLFWLQRKKDLRNKKKEKEKKTVAEGILSPPASCHFHSTAHLSPVMSNRSVPGGQISTLSQWQFKSQSSPQLVWTSEPLTGSQIKVEKWKRGDLRALVVLSIWKSEHISAPGAALRLRTFHLLRAIKANCMTRLKRLFCFVF